QGAEWILSGTIGEVTIDRGQFKAELRGLANAYTRVLGRLYTPGCAWNLGDENCTKDLTDFTVTGTIDSANADGVTLYDSARTEPGPSGGIAISGITNANPGIVPATAHGFTAGEAITVAGVIGPALLNTDTVVYAPVSANSFALGIDTSDTAVYPAYVSGGTVHPLGSGAGYFTFGKITFDSGANAGLSMDVKSY